MSLTVTTDNAARVISVEDVKRWTGIEVDDDDLRIRSLIDAATEHVEHVIRETVKQKSYAYKIDGFESPIKLPKSPLSASPNVSITYIDEDGATQTLATSVYDVDTDSDPAEIRLAYDQAWPGVRDVPQSVTINYTAGYTSVPEKIKLAILMLIDHWYEHRGSVTEMRLAETPMSVDSLLASYRHYQF